MQKIKIFKLCSEFNNTDGDKFNTFYDTFIAMEKCKNLLKNNNINDLSNNNTYSVSITNEDNVEFNSRKINDQLLIIRFVVTVGDDIGITNNPDGLLFINKNSNHKIFN